MENQAQILKEERRRRFRLILPVLVLPFLTLMFWAMGGGKVEQSNANETHKSKGLNNILPDANLKDDQGDKMSYYDRAVRDSASRNALIKTDPYYQQPAIQSPGTGPVPGQPAYPGYGPGAVPQNYTGGAYNDPNEAKVYQKLQQLNQSLNQTPQQSYQEQKTTVTDRAVNTPDLSKLERMMEQMQSGNRAPDAETEQLNGMLERILDIQHPDRVQEKLRKTSEEHKGQVYGISSGKKREIISLLEAGKEKKQSTTDETNDFYAFSDTEDVIADQNVISAIVDGTQVIVNGATVKLRLLDDIYINGKLIPKDKFIYGVAALSGERLGIKIPGIQYQKFQFPVDLSVIDIDGLDGIYIPGAIARDVAKESTDRAIQDVKFASMSDNMGLQAMGTGVEAAKSILSKKVRLIQVTIKAGYKVLIRDEKQK